MFRMNKFDSISSKKNFFQPFVNFIWLFISCMPELDVEKFRSRTFASSKSRVTKYGGHNMRNNFDNKNIFIAESWKHGTLDRRKKQHFIRLLGDYASNLNSAKARRRVIFHIFQRLKQYFTRSALGDIKVSLTFSSPVGTCRNRPYLLMWIYTGH